MPLWFIAAFKDKREDAAAFLAHYELAMCDALEAVGTGFPFEVSNGRIVPARVTYSPPDKGEG